MSSSRSPVVLSWSGGKDSSLTLATLRADPSFEVVALLTSITREYDRVSIHGVRRTLLEAQAASVGLPLIEISLEPQCTNDAYEAAFHAALAEIRATYPSVRHLAFGDLFLADVRAYRERMLERSGFTPIFPIWGRDTRQLATEFVNRGYKAHLVAVDTTQLDASYAGRAFDHSLLAELPPTVDPCGERGEFHTFVFNGPGFGTPISVELGEVVLRDERFAFCDLVPRSLARA
jgi:uncharacterized protein (TIGR00290 family)